MGLREITIGVPPVGCAVLAYNYFNFDMVEAPHGRALAVATGIKRVKPDRFVISYQGMGTSRRLERLKRFIVQTGGRRSPPFSSITPSMA